MGVQQRVGVVGAGAWGTALAILANRTGSKVKLWTRNSNVLESVEDSRINESYLPGIMIDPAIKITSSLEEVCDADMLIVAIPSQNMRAVCISMADRVDTDMPFILATKGIERGSLALMSEVVQSVMPLNPVAVLSGPNFADEAARGQPTATTVACEDPELGERILYAIGGKHFRPYMSDDLIGTQLGGAVKNVIAIACGIAMGRDLGENTRAAIMTRSIAEISRLTEAKGGKQSTLMGLSGMGDLILTCSSIKSRNMSLGIAVGRGRSLEDILGQRKGVVEGVATSESVVLLAAKLGVTMPICSAIHAVLNEKITVEQVIGNLLERPFSYEK